MCENHAVLSNCACGGTIREIDCGSMLRRECTSCHTNHGFIPRRKIAEAAPEDLGPIPHPYCTSRAGEFRQ